MSGPIAVLTLAAGRHTHLIGQVEGLIRQSQSPDMHVVISMGDKALRDGQVPIRSGAWSTMMSYLAVQGPGLPLARARNLAARTAIDAGAEVLIFLDVDCIPSPTLVQEYARVVREHDRPEATTAATSQAATSLAATSLAAMSLAGRPPEQASVRGAGGPAIFSGDVAYLPSPPEDGYALDGLADVATPSAARPVLPAGQTQAETRFELFWSLSFAMSAVDFEASGGFCEDYHGYGGEDTDFAHIVRRLGGSLTWVGGAGAYHQHHDTQLPPVQHLDAIVRNANVFYDRWGWWPMDGWLQAFATLGLAARQGPESRWAVVASS